MDLPNLIAHASAQARLHYTGETGKRVAWRQIGQGSPLVLIHGGHGSWLHWLRNVEALAQGHALYLVDLPGYGDSDATGDSARDPQRMPELLARVRSGIDELLGPDTPVDLAAFSFGGVVASQLAALRGGIRKLALVGSAGHGGVRRQPTPMVEWNHPDREQRRAALQHNLKALMVHAPEAADELAIDIHEASCLRTRFHSRSISRGSSVAEALQARSGPTLLLWGEHDVTCDPREALPRLTAGHPERQGHLIPDAGHWVQYERAAEVNRLLTDWFRAAP